MIFVSLGGLNDEFENIRNQVINSRKPTDIEEVYAQIDVEEQRCHVIIERVENIIDQLLLVV